MKRIIITSLLLFALLCFLPISYSYSSERIPDIDAVALEHTLKAWWTRYPLKSMIGIHRNSDTTATAYFILIHETTREEVTGKADLIYLSKKGWYILNQVLQPGTISYTPWNNVFKEIERKSDK